MYRQVISYLTRTWKIILPYGKFVVTKNLIQKLSFQRLVRGIAAVKTQIQSAVSPR